MVIHSRRTDRVKKEEKTVVVNKPVEGIKEPVVLPEVEETPVVERKSKRTRKEIEKSLNTILHEEE